jgi:hypothetical protein
MTGLSERQKLIAQIRNFPRDLDANLAKFSETEMDIPVRPGEWTVRQIVHHVADAHLNGYIRMKLVLTETRPILKPYDQEVWAELSDMKADLHSSLQILAGLHVRWASLLEGLPEESWSRKGVHLENGLVSLDDLLVTYAHHGETHIQQINQLRQ